MSETARDIHVLVVDDQLTNHRLVQAVFATKDIQVTSVMSGKEAIEACEDRNFNLILMDLHMPQMDGATAAKIIRDQNADWSIPIYMWTGDTVFDWDSVEEKCWNGIIKKPTSVATILSLAGQAEVLSEDANFEHLGR